MNPPRTLDLIDTHTGGEVTRVVMDASIGVPDLPASELCCWLRDEADWIRRSLTSEPRGQAHAVGAVYRKRDASDRDRDIDASVVFFNNRGYLGMCGHGLIGVVEALRFQNELTQAGGYPQTVSKFCFDTPAGPVTARLDADRHVTIQNVPSYRLTKGVRVAIKSPVAGFDFDRDQNGSYVVGDIAWGGNWFLIVPRNDLQNHDVETLTRACVEIRRGIDGSGLRGQDGAIIDHVELSMDDPNASRTGVNFVLCPGGHHDRSPCGTGTSAKIACLAAEGKLDPGQIWTQRATNGSVFQASYEIRDGDLVPKIRGRAFVTASTRVIFDHEDSIA